MRIKREIPKSFTGTMKHALPTYVAVLGARPGTTLAVSAQVLRSVFLLICIAGLALFWR